MTALRRAAHVLQDLARTENQPVRQAKFVNLLTPKEKAKYVDECWDLLQKAYSDIGGFKSAVDKNHLIADSFIWKLNTRGGKVVAVCVYKKRYGRKLIGLATDGSAEGKTALREMLKEDLTRAWAECSGAVEKTFLKLGGEKYIVPARYAEQLTDKKCTPLEDGKHYTRDIGGKPFTKVIIGTPQGIQITRDV